MIEIFQSFDNFQEKYENDLENIFHEFSDYYYSISDISWLKLKYYYAMPLIIVQYEPPAIRNIHRHY